MAITIITSEQQKRNFQSRRSGGTHWQLAGVPPIFPRKVDHFLEMKAVLASKADFDYFSWFLDVVISEQTWIIRSGFDVESSRSEYSRGMRFEGEVRVVSRIGSDRVEFL